MIFAPWVASCVFLQSVHFLCIDFVSMFCNCTVLIRCIFFKHVLDLCSFIDHLTIYTQFGLFKKQYKHIQRMSRVVGKMVSKEEPTYIVIWSSSWERADFSLVVRTHRSHAELPARVGRYNPSVSVLRHWNWGVKHWQGLTLRLQLLAMLKSVVSVRLRVKRFPQCTVQQLSQTKTGVPLLEKPFVDKTSTWQKNRHTPARKIEWNCIFSVFSAPFFKSEPDNVSLKKMCIIYIYIYAL